MLFSAGLAALGGGACGESTPAAKVKAASFRYPLTKTYAEGHPVQSFDVGDVDGDGHLDVVTNEVNRLLVFRGDGTGALGADPREGGLTMAVEVTTADVTGDGRADTITAGLSSGTVRVFPGRADGTLGPSIAYGVPAQFIARFVVVDMTGDGALDLLVQAQALDPTAGVRTFLAVLTNRGNGAFDEPSSTPLTGAPAAWTVADVDSDGDADIVAADASALGLRVLLNDGRGHLGEPQSLGIDGGIGRLFAGDFDGDGRTDLGKIVDTGDQLAVFRNVGGGAFQALPPVDMGGFANDLVTADVNGDGRTDVVAIVSSGAVEILHADGVTLTRVATYATGGAAVRVRPGDFDHDGAVDLAVANGGLAGGTLAVLMNDGRGRFEAADISLVPGEALAMALADLTGDGVTDMVVSSGGVEVPSLVTFESSASGNPQAPARMTPVPAVGGPAALAAGDLNNDRIADLVVTSQAEGRALVLLGSGDGRFAAPTSVDIGFAERIAVGDLDGDAFLDLAVGSLEKAGDIRLFTGQGNGAFVPLQTYHGGDGPTSALRITDLNGDGRPDVVGALTASDGTGIISILPSSGPRAFGVPIEVRLVPPVDAFVVSDLDRDGRGDLVGSSTSGTEAPLLFGAPGGRPFVRRSLGFGVPTLGVASADFNKDGWPDLAFGDSSTGDILVLMNDHRGAFRERQAIPLRLETRGLAAADLNGDGKIDLAVLTPAGVVTLWNTSQ